MTSKLLFSNLSPLILAVTYTLSLINAYKQVIARRQMAACTLHLRLISQRL